MAQYRGAKRSRSSALEWGEFRETGCLESHAGQRALRTGYTPRSGIVARGPHQDSLCHLGGVKCAIFRPDKVGLAGERWYGAVLGRVSTARYSPPVACIQVFTRIGLNSTRVPHKSLISSGNPVRADWVPNCRVMSSNHAGRSSPGQTEAVQMGGSKTNLPWVLQDVGHKQQVLRTCKR